MKIVFIASRELDKIGGIETYMANLCLKLVKYGHNVILYCEGNKYDKFSLDGVKIISFKSLNNRFLNKLVIGFLATIHSLIHNRAVDIYHYNAIPSAFFSWIPKIFQQNVIYQGHGFEWQRTKWSPFHQRIIRFLESITVYFNNNITMVSQDQTDYIKQHYNKEATTITPAINLPKRKFLDSTILETLGLQKGGYILFLGRLVEEKNPDLLIRAYLRSNVKHLKLVIAGDDVRAKKYKKQLNILAQDNPNILLTGAVYNEDKETLTQNCKAFCIPSSIEGLPISLLEAMSYKKLCIASDIAACKEALGDTGFYFKDNCEKDLTRALNVLHSDSLTGLGDRAYDRVKNNFTWDIITKQYEEFCLGIVKQQNMK